MRASSIFRTPFRLFASRFRDVWRAAVPSLRRHRCTSRRSQRRRERVECGPLAFGEFLEDRTLLAAIAWDGEGGDGIWANPANWFDQTNNINNVQPGTNDSVFIPAKLDGTSVVVTSTQSLTIASLDGDGELRLSDGTFTITDTSTINGRLILEGAILAGTGTLTVDDLEWTNGRISHADIVVTAAFNLNSLSDPRLLQGGHLTLGPSATGIWTGRHLRLSGSLDVAGHLEIQTDRDALGGGSLHVVPGGSIRKSATSGEQVIQSLFTNDGLVSVESGTFRLDQGNTPGQEDDGTYEIAAGANLQFSGGSEFSGAARTISSNATMTGAGGLIFGVNATDRRSTYISAGTYDVTGPVVMNAGTTHYNMDAVLPQLTLTFDPGAGTSHTLGGTGRLMVGSLEWINGRVESIVTVTDTLSLNSNNDPRLLQGGQLDLADTATGVWTGAVWRMTGQFNIAGNFESQTGSRMIGGGTIAILSTGRFHKSGGGTQQIDSAWIQSGELTIDAGQSLNFVNDFVQSRGTTVLMGEATFSDALQLQGGILRGTGTVTGDVSNSGGTVSPGMSAGTLTIDGDYVQGNGGTFEVEINGTSPGNEYDRLDVLGNATLAGDLTVSRNVETLLGQTFEILSVPDGKSVSGAFETSNAAAVGMQIQQDSDVVTLVVTNPQASEVSWVSDNDGFWEVATNWSTGVVPGPDDVVVIDRAGSPEITIASNVTIRDLTNAETLIIDSGAALTWNGQIWVGAGTTEIRSGGELTITGSDNHLLLQTIVNQGELFWLEGNIDAIDVALENHGLFEIDSEATLAGNVDLQNSGTIRNLSEVSIETDGEFINDVDGAIDVSGAQLTVSGDGQFENLGLVTIENTTLLLDDAVGGRSFRNADTGVVQIAAGELRIENGDFDNTGSVEIADGGELILSVGDFNNGGVTQIANGSGLTIDAGAFTNSGEVIVAGGSELQVGGHFLQLSGSTSVTNGVIAPVAGFLLQDGTLNGEGAISGSLVHSGGILNPSGILMISGDYVQQADAVLQIELLDPTGNGILLVDGSATVVGTLLLSLQYQALVGATFDFIVANSVVGEPVSNAVNLGLQRSANPTALRYEVVNGAIPDISIEVPSLFRFELGNIAVGNTGRLTVGSVDAELTALDAAHDATVVLGDVVLSGRQLAIDSLTFVFDTVIPETGIAIRNMAIGFQELVIDFTDDVRTQTNIVVDSLNSQLAQIDDHFRNMLDYISAGLRSVFGTANATVYQDGSCDSGIPGVCGIEFNFDDFGDLRFDPNRPFQLGPLSVDGELAYEFVTIDTNEDSLPDTDTWIGRLVGSATDQVLSLDTELVYSEYGPIAGRISSSNLVPVADLIGAFGAAATGNSSDIQNQLASHTGFALTGLNGGFLFDTQLPQPSEPADLLNTSEVSFPLVLSTAEVTHALERLFAAPNSPATTWESDFALVVSGGLSHVSAPALLGSHVTLAANIVNPFADGAPVEPLPGFTLFGKGTFELFGDPFADVGVLLDFDDALSPHLQFAVDLQTAAEQPGNLLTQVVEANGVIEVEIDTAGIPEASIVAMNQFFAGLNRSRTEDIEPIFRQIVGELLEQIAGRLEANHDHPLAQLLLDVDSSQAELVVDAVESRAVISAEFLEIRLTELLDVAVTDIEQLMNNPLSAPQVLAKRVRKAAVAANAFFLELLTAPKYAALAAQAVMRQAAGGEEAAVHFMRTMMNSLTSSVADAAVIISDLHPLIAELAVTGPAAVPQLIADQLPGLEEAVSQLSERWSVVNDLAEQLRLVASGPPQRINDLVRSVSKSVHVALDNMQRAESLGIQSDRAQSAAAQEEYRQRIVGALDAANAAIFVIPNTINAITGAAAAAMSPGAAADSLLRTVNAVFPLVAGRLDQIFESLQDMTRELDSNQDDNLKLQHIALLNSSGSLIQETQDGLQALLAAAGSDPKYQTARDHLNMAIENNAALGILFDTINTEIERFNNNEISAVLAVAAVGDVLNAATQVIPSLPTNLASMISSVAQADLMPTAQAVVQIVTNQVPRLQEAETQAQSLTYSLADLLSAAATPERLRQATDIVVQAVQWVDQFRVGIVRTTALLAVDGFHAAPQAAFTAANVSANTANRLLKQLHLEINRAQAGDTELSLKFAQWRTQLQGIDLQLADTAAQFANGVAQLPGAITAQSVIIAENALTELAEFLGNGDVSHLGSLLQASGLAQPVTKPALLSHLSQLLRDGGDSAHVLFAELVEFFRNQPGVVIAEQHAAAAADHPFLANVNSLTQSRLETLGGLASGDLEDFNPDPVTEPELFVLKQALVAAPTILNRSLLIGAAIGIAPVAPAFPIGQALISVAQAGDFFRIINPSLTVRGDVAPVLLGMPVNPIDQIEVTIAKDKLSFTGLVSLLSPLNDLTPLPLPIEDAVELKAVFAFDNLFRDIAFATIPQIDFTEGWYGTFEGEVNVLGLNLGTHVQGAVFSASTGSLPPDHPLIAQIQNAGAYDQYEEFRHTGGIVLSGDLRLPSFLVDPFKWFDELQSRFDGAADPLTLIQLGLDSISTRNAGELQVFVPNVPARLLKLAELHGEISGRSADHVRDQVRAILGLPTIVVDQADLFTDVPAQSVTQESALTHTATSLTGQYGAGVAATGELLGMSFSNAEVHARVLKDEVETFIARVTDKFDSAPASTTAADSSMTAVNMTLSQLRQQLTEVRNALQPLVSSVAPLNAAISAVDSLKDTLLPPVRSAIDVADGDARALLANLQQFTTDPGTEPAVLVNALTGQAQNVLAAAIAATNAVVSIAGSASPLTAVNAAISFLQQQLANFSTAAIAGPAIGGIAGKLGVIEIGIESASQAMSAAKATVQSTLSDLVQPLAHTLEIIGNVKGQQFAVPIDLSGTLPRIGIELDVDNSNIFQQFGAPQQLVDVIHWLDELSGAENLSPMSTTSLRIYSPGYDLESEDPVQQLGGFGVRHSDHVDLSNMFGNIFGDVSFQVTPAGFAGQFLGYGELNLFDVISFPVGSSDNPLIHGTISESGCLSFSANLPGVGEQQFFFGLTANACDPQLFIDDITVVEGSEAGQVALIPVRVLQLPQLTSQDKILLQYRVTSGTGDHRAQAGNDYQVGNGNSTVGELELTLDDLVTENGVTMLRGEIAVMILDDTVSELEESFTVELSVLEDQPNVIIGSDKATVTILDDDFMLPDRPDAAVLYDFQFVNPSPGGTPFPSLQPAPGSTVAATAFRPTPSPSLPSFDTVSGLPEANSEFAFAARSRTTPEFFSFTITADQNFVPRRLEFWDLPHAGDGWDVFAVVGSHDPVQLVVEELITVTQESLPNAFPGLVGWRKLRVDVGRALCDTQYFPNPDSPIPQIVPCFIDATPIEFRLVPTQQNVAAPTHLRTLDNVALFGGEDVQFGTFFDDTILLQTLLHGEMQITIDGSGIIQVQRDPSDGVTDPIESGDLSVQVIGADATTTVSVSMQFPDGQGGADVFEFASFTSNNGFSVLDLTGIGTVGGLFEFGGPVSQIRLNNLAADSTISIDGTPQDSIQLIAAGVLGNGVEIEFPGELNATTAAWIDGQITAGSIGSISTIAGHFGPDVFLQSGFGTIAVNGGNFTSSRFITGLGSARGDGSGDTISATAISGVGGSIISPRINVDGDLQLLSATGGRIATQLTAHRVDSVLTASTRESSNKADIRGSFDTSSIGRVSAVGGDILATLITRDKDNSDLTVTAIPDASGRGGKINSPRSFHIAGGVQEISAVEITLGLVAGGTIGAIRSGDENTPASSQINIVARRLGDVRAFGNMRLTVRTSGTAEELGGVPAVGVIQVSGGRLNSSLQTQPGTLVGPAVDTGHLADGVSSEPLSVEITNPLGLLHVVTVDWGDGVVDELSEHGPLDSTLRGEHVYSSPGEFTSRITITDVQGQINIVEQVVVIRTHRLTDDPNQPGTQILTVGGTRAHDTIDFRLRGNETEIDLRLNGLLLGRFRTEHLSRLVAFGGAGHDSIIVRGHSIGLPTEFHGGSGHDFLRGSQGANVIFGDSGHDTIHTFNSADVIFGGPGHDEIVSRGGDDSIDAGGGNNLVRSGDGNDTIITGNGHNEVFGGGGNDVITTGAGNDLVQAGDGDDIIEAGNGRNVIQAGDGHDWVTTGDGNDEVRTAQGNDTVSAGGGNDWIHTGLGNDLVDAGPGHDVVYTGGGDDITIAGDGNDAVFSGEGNDIAVGGSGKDNLFGARGRDLLIGGVNEDRLFGGGDDDLLIAGVTNYDQDISALKGLLNEWTSNRSYADRVDNLRNGDGENLADTGIRLRAGVTVHDDNDRDSLFGMVGLDWFFADIRRGSGDRLFDRDENELFDSL